LAGAGWWAQQRQVAPAEVSYTTTYGQTRTVQLPDGSQVTLNAQSTLRYPAAWDRGASAPREVWLDGEGYFSVQHQPDNQRFVVHTTAGLNVEVLGTQFTVYRRHAQARVQLLKGKVLVDFADQARADITMRPGEVVETADDRPANVVHEAAATSRHAVWTGRELVFDSTPLAEVAIRLQDTYGLSVIIENAALNTRKFTGAIPAGDLPLLCQTLEKTLQLKVQRQARKIVISTR
ncbi:MAG: FecR domain-containing protein, partial [Hymenobacter sp.]|nr:FecR domain-containing protein [Hymenobacter sp.]